LTTLNKLCNLILPPNKNGSIEEAEVVQLIEFMAKDIPSYQKPLRDGINWINKESDLNFNQKFTDIPEESQKQILDNYTRTELKKLNTWIKHDRDLDFTYAGLRQVVDKYLVQDRSNGQVYETPQFMYMMIAATLLANYPAETRMNYIKKY